MMTVRRQDTLGAGETRTQGALVAALRGRPRTPYRTAQRVRGGQRFIV